jgi:uncharacterized protein YndB with AHSA1/START domain
MANPFRYSYKAQIVIASKKELVWKILTDLDNYQRWNPFTPRVETNWEIGHPVSLTVQMTKGKSPILQKEYMVKFNPQDEFAWGMKWSVFLKAERIQRLSEDEHENTMYFTEDVIEGLLSPIVHFIYGKSIQKGFEELAIALKRHLEDS